MGCRCSVCEASAQVVAHEHHHPDVVIGDTVLDGFGALLRRTQGKWAVLEAYRPLQTTRILVELAPDDTAPANLFDLNGRTLVFTPDGHGGYSRAVADGEEIQFQNFMFDFAADVGCGDGIVGLFPVEEPTKADFDRERGRPNGYGSARPPRLAGHRDLRNEHRCPHR